MLSPDDAHILNAWLRIADRWETSARRIRETVERAFELNTMKGIEDMPAFAFNAQGIDAVYGGGGGLPVGKHPVAITHSELKNTQDNTGGYIEFTLTAIDGPNKGGSTKDRLNVHNKSNQAQEIAQKQLAAYCSVIGVPGFNATEELHNKPFVVEMGPQKDKPEYTEVKKLFDMNGNEPGKAGSGPQQALNGGGFGQQQGGNFGGQQQGAPQQNGFGQQGGQQQQQQQQGGWQGQQGGGQQQGQGGGFGATGTGQIPDQQQGQQQGGGWQQQGGQGQQQPQQGQGGGWQQQGGAAAGGSPGWGQR